MSAKSKKAGWPLWLVDFATILFWLSPLLLFPWYLGCSGSRPFTRQPFTPEAWATADAEQRGQMVDDLQSRGLLDRKTCGEVLALLGSPDAATARSWKYDVGYRGGNPNFPLVFAYTLHVDLGADGQVEHVIVDD
jgi:hypothetical protein